MKPNSRTGTNKGDDVSDKLLRNPNPGRWLKVILPTIVTLVVLLMLALWAGGRGYSIPSDMVAVHVGNGPLEAKKVKGCVPANDRQWFWQTNDSYFPFPTSEREWDATGADGSDSQAFTSVTDDNVVMQIPVTVRFTLRTDCDTLTEFYTKYARRYGAEFNTDGGYNQQWITLLRKLVADPTDATLDRIVQKYKWRDVWNNPETKVAIEKELTDALAGPGSLMVQTAKASYFEGITVLVGTPSPERQELKDAVALEQQAVANAQSKEAEAKAREAQARAEVAVAKAEAAKKRAEIDGYPSVGDYLRAKAIEKGINPYQPTYVVPQGLTK